MHETLGQVDGATKLNQEALDLRLKEGPLKLPVISFLENNLGCAYNAVSDHERALVALEKSLFIWDRALELEGKPPQQEPVTTANIGKCLFYLNRFTEARHHVDTAIAVFRRSELVNWGGLA